MARIELAPAVLDDFDRLFDYVAAFDPEEARRRLASIVEALQILVENPLIGRPAREGKRELVMGQGASGSLALYRYLPRVDTVFVLAVRSQREAGYSYVR